MEESFALFQRAREVAHGLDSDTTNVSILYSWLLAPFSLFSNNLLFYAQIINLLCIVASGVLLYKITKTLTQTVFGFEVRWASLVIALLFYCTPLVWVNALTGLETSLFSLFLLLCVYLFQYSLNDPALERNAIDLTFSLSFLAGLIRTEGYLLTVVLLVVLLSSRKKRALYLQSFALYFLLPLVLYLGWYFSSNDAILPQTEFSNLVRNDKILRGLQYFRFFLSSTLCLWFLSVVALKHFFRNKILQLLGLWSLTVVVYYLLVDATGGAYDRFLIPVEACLFILSGIGIYTLALSRGFFSRVAVVFFLVIFHTALNYYSSRAQEARSAHQELWNNHYELVAKELRAIPNQGAISILYPNTGVLSYFAQTRSVDLSLVSRSNDQGEAIDKVAGQTLDIILIPINHPLDTDDTCRSLFSGTSGFELYQAILNDPRFNSFRPLTSFQGPTYDLAVLVNSRSEHVADIEGTLSARMRSRPEIYGERPYCVE